MSVMSFRVRPEEERIGLQQLAIGAPEHIVQGIETEAQLEQACIDALERRVTFIKRSKRHLDPQQPRTLEDTGTGRDHPQLIALRIDFQQIDRACRQMLLDDGVERVDVDIDAFSHAHVDLASVEAGFGSNWQQRRTGIRFEDLEGLSAGRVRDRDVRDTHRVGWKPLPQ